jgi:hypothetical protein
MTEHNYTPEMAAKGAQALEARIKASIVVQPVIPGQIGQPFAASMLDCARAVLDATAGDIAARALEAAADTVQREARAVYPDYLDVGQAASYLAEVLRADARRLRVARLREGGD